YHTPMRSRNLPQVTDFKQFRSFERLTVEKTGTYTDSMIPRAALARALLVAALACAWRPHAVAQAIQKSLYVSVVNDAGQPVPDLGPSDFLVREDNIAREVLAVRPADQPMQVALLVDTSQRARSDIPHMRAALPAFASLMTKPNDRGARNQIAVIGFGERP